MTLSIKEGVVIDRLHPAMVVAIPTVMQVFARHGFQSTITSGNEGEHGPRSFHKVIPLRALDWRTWANSSGKQIDEGIKAAIVMDLRAELGPDYDVVLEATHIHTEYDPR